MLFPERGREAIGGMSCEHEAEESDLSRLSQHSDLCQVSTVSSMSHGVAHFSVSHEIVVTGNATKLALFCTKTSVGSCHSSYSACNRSGVWTGGRLDRVGDRQRHPRVRVRSENERPDLESVRPGGQPVAQVVDAPLDVDTGSLDGRYRLSILGCVHLYRLTFNSSRRTEKSERRYNT